jgi:hypothetical protein
VIPPLRLKGFSIAAAIQRLLALALKQANNKVSAAARSLGVTRDYVRYRLSGRFQDEEPAEVSISSGSYAATHFATILLTRRGFASNSLG